MPETVSPPKQTNVLLSQGFRPFFLFGAFFAGWSILLWLQIYSGAITSPSLFVPSDWHSHEMLFGYAPAIITGFLLTAIPNWTGRLPVRGRPLLLLINIWFFGRVAIYGSAYIGWIAAGLIDCAFLAAVAFMAAREIIAGQNWRNIKVLLPIGLMFCANVLFHGEAHFNGSADYAKRFGLAAILILIMLIGGRIIPSFTRNWLAKENPGRLPVPFNRFDMVVVVSSALAFVGWILMPALAHTGVLMIAVAGLHLARLSRWAGYRCLGNPLLLVLHSAYLFVAAGFLFGGLAILLPDHVAETAGIHAFGVGAIGLMTLSVMVRATLGHTGLGLRAGRGTQVIFALLLLSGIVRIAAGIGGLGDLAISPSLIEIAGYCWVAAFFGFVVLFAKPLVTPRRPRS